MSLANIYKIVYCGGWMNYFSDFCDDVLYGNCL